MKYEGSRLACAPPNQSTFTCGCVFLSDSVLCAILKCLLYFSICSSPEDCRPLERLGSRCECVEAGDKNDIPESQGELKEEKSLGHGKAIREQGRPRGAQGSHTLGSSAPAPASSRAATAAASVVTLMHARGSGGRGGLPAVWLCGRRTPGAQASPGGR